MSLRLPLVDLEPMASEAPTPIALPAEVAPSLLASPCVGTCRLDPETGWCLGCARTREELADWRDLDAAAGDDGLAGMRVGDALGALPGVGPRGVERILDACGIAPTRRLRGLGVRQRRALLEGTWGRGA